MQHETIAVCNTKSILTSASESLSNNKSFYICLFQSIQLDRKGNQQSQQQPNQKHCQD